MEQSEVNRRRLRPLKTLRLVLLGVLLCALVGGGCFLAGRYTGRNGGSTELSAVVVQNQLTEISELASVTYSYTNMAQYENSGEFYGMKVPFTTKRFILTYDGVIKAGVDLSRAEVSVSGSAVTVRLPKAQILSHEIDEGSVQVFDQQTSLFNPFTVDEFTAFQADQKKAMEEKALDKGLLSQAQTKAEDSVRLLLEKALPEGGTLTVRS